MEDQKTIRLRIQKDEDRQTVAGILVKNGYGCKGAKDYKITRDGTKSKVLEPCILIQGAEDAEW